MTEKLINGRLRIDGQHSIESVHEFVASHVDVDNHTKVQSRDRRKRYPFGNHAMKPWSLRYFVFMTKGVKCSCCGMEGTHYFIERNPNETNYHFNLYGMKDGKEMMMTKDHHIPLSGDGFNTIQNLVPMCRECNQLKGKTIPQD